MERNILDRVQSLKSWFRGYEDNYLIIGGTACSLILEEQGASFRMTKDVDIVLLLEVLDADFGKRFWDYVIEADYKHCQKSTGLPQYYRFYEPKSNEHPEMIELFSRSVDGFNLPEDTRITPIPISEDISSLSAILLNDHYYSFLREGVRKIDGLPVLDELYIIPFKAKAWLDLTERRSKGESIDRSDINKHKRDIFRLLDITIDGAVLILPEYIENDMRAYINAIIEQSDNTPKKERITENVKIERLIKLFGIQMS